MQMTGEREIAADRAAVWAALLDPEVLKACVPGCQEMTGTPEDGFEAVGGAEGRPGEGDVQGPRDAQQHGTSAKA